MSTKIYNGIKFKSRDWKEILDQLLSVRKSALSIAESQISKGSLENFIKYNDLIDNDQYQIYSKLRDAVSSDVFDKYNFVPKFEFSVYLFPTKEGDIYGYYFDSNINEYYKLLDPFVSDFHYQNQSDKPDNITDEEWDFRENKWNELVNFYFSEKGFKFNIISINDIDQVYFYDLIKSIIPSLKREEKIENILK